MNRRHPTKLATIQDARFQRAETLPQFRTLKQIEKRLTKHVTLSTTTTNNNNNNNNKKKKSGNPQVVGEEGQVMVDPRFAAIHTDMRFSFTGDIDVSVNKHGRTVRKTKGSHQRPKSKDTLQQHIQEDKDDNHRSIQRTVEVEDQEKKKKKERLTDNPVDYDSSSSSSSYDNLTPQDPEARIKYLTALSRGELSLSSSSSSSSSEDEDDDFHSTQDDDDASASSSSDRLSLSLDQDSPMRGILDPVYAKQQNAPMELTYDSSRFMAICNMDWTSVRAVDLFVILSSFVPPGSVLRVGVYPSDFGMERMKRDYEMGPQGIWKSNDSQPDIASKQYMKSEEEEDSVEECVDESSQEEEDDGDDIRTMEDALVVDTDLDPEKLRAYEASKMRYYFAIAEFSSTEAADAAYKDLDGVEVGHSSATIDLRLIPEEDLQQVIQNRNVRDEATHIPSKYVLPDFVVSALQQSSVRCTWDEGDKERERLLTAYSSKKGNWLDMENDDDLRVYLASGMNGLICFFLKTRCIFLS